MCSLWDAHESSFPGYFCVVAARNRESVNNSSIVVIVEGIISFAE